MVLYSCVWCFIDCLFVAKVYFVVFTQLKGDGMLAMVHHRLDK